MIISNIEFNNLNGDFSKIISRVLAVEQELSGDVIRRVESTESGFVVWDY